MKTFQMSNESSSMYDYLYLSIHFNTFLKYLWYWFLVQKTYSNTGTGFTKWARGCASTFSCTDTESEIEWVKCCDGELCNSATSAKVSSQCLNGYFLYNMFWWFWVYLYKCFHMWRRLWGWSLVALFVMLTLQHLDFEWQHQRNVIIAYQLVNKTV